MTKLYRGGRVRLVSYVHLVRKDILGFFIQSIRTSIEDLQILSIPPSLCQCGEEIADRSLYQGRSIAV